MLVLVGEFGLGKSVMVFFILCFLFIFFVVYFFGDICFYGELLFYVSEQMLCGVCGNKIVMIFQELMVLFNLLYMLEKQFYEVLLFYWGMCWEVVRVEMIGCLDWVGICQVSQCLCDYLYQFFGGECQCVMIVMVLLIWLELLIVDELIIVFDVFVQVQILFLLWEFQCEFNMGLLFIIYNFSIVKKLVDLVVVM